MAEDDRTFRTSTRAANRAQTQGPGAGRQELDAQRAPSRDRRATDPGRTEPFGKEAAPEERAFEGAELDDRNAAGLEEAGDLGAGTPAGVDVHDLDEQDAPEDDWGEAAEEGTLHSANHSRRAIKTEGERGQGAKTRRRNKDIVSRRR